MNIKKIVLFGLSIAVFSFSHSASVLGSETLPVISVSDNISQDTTWEAGYVYVIQNNITVETNAALTLDPGVIVKFSNNSSVLGVNGALQVNGTSSNKVYLTSIKDDSVGGDTNGDGDITLPSKGDWANIIFGSNSVGNFNHAVARYGNGSYSYSGIINNSGGTVNLLNTDISYSSGAYQASGNFSITDSNIHDNFTGFEQIGGSSTITGSEFNSNTVGITIDAGISDISGNNIQNTNSDGISIYGSGTLVDVYDNTISISSIGQGGVKVSEGELNLVGNIFINNNSSSYTYPVTIRYPAVFSHSGNTFSGSGKQVIHYIGTIESDITWDQQDSPYIIGSLKVGTGVKLTINPGTVIKFHERTPLIIQGTLEVNGSSTDKVYFTSIKDDTVGGDTNRDGSATLPQDQDWGVIKFENGSVGNFNHAIVRYGGWQEDRGISILGGTVNITDSEVGYSGTVYQYSGSMFITNSRIHNGGSGNSGFYQSDGTSIISGSEFDGNNAGVSIAGGTSEISGSSMHDNLIGILVRNGPVMLTSNEIRDNNYGLRYFSGGLSTSLNSFTGNSVYGVDNRTTTSIDVSNSWWGNSSGPEHSTNPSGTGDEVSDYVAFTPWLTCITQDRWSVSPCDPVIIVPGIMGSRLDRVSDNEEVWPNIDEMTKLFNNKDAYLNELKLSSTGQQISGSEMEVGEIITELEDEIFYKNLVNLFTDSGYVKDQDLFVIPYDWRLSIEDNIALITDTISDAVPGSYTGKVNIVAHSMGGLLAKAYLSQLTDTSHIGKVIFAGVPQIGSPKTFKALTYGDNMGFQVKKLGFDISVLNEKRVKEITQNMPSVYQLLPSREYFDTISGGYINDFRTGINELDYNETVDFMLENSEDSRNSDLLDLADDFHVVLDAFTPSVDVYNIVGCSNFMTLGGINVYSSKKRSLLMTNGDGTVPTFSALYNSTGFNNYFVSGSNHLGLVVDAPPLGLIENIVINNTNDVPTGVSESSSVCSPSPAKKTKQYSTHSPVELHLYDNDDNHVGLNSDGDIDLQIPGSAYYSIDDNTFIFVPDGDYKVEIKATDVGNFDFKVKDMENEDVGKTVTYLDIPIENSALAAELGFGASDSTQLEVDSDGNGTVDVYVSPSSVLSTSDSADSTPPITTASLSGTAGANDWYISDVSLTLSASDNSTGAGVFNTEYSTDNGLTWNTYSSPFVISNEGVNTVLYRSRDLVGNIEGEKFMEFKIDKTNPEAQIYFDISAEEITVSGTDNLTAPTIIQTTSDKYLITDESGRNIEIELQKDISESLTTGVYAFHGKVVGLEYNGVVTTLPDNSITYSWVSQLGVLTNLEQGIYVENNFRVTSTYNDITDSTDITINDSNGISIDNVSGLAIIRLETGNSMLEYGY